MSEVPEPVVKSVQDYSTPIHYVSVWLFTLGTVIFDLEETVWAVLSFGTVVVVFFHEGRHVCIVVAALLGEPCAC